MANPVVLVSEYFLKTTGEGLPPGPGGIYGATEGISYLVIVGVVGWSIYTKVKTGSGLPGSFLGAVEGFSYLSLVAGGCCAAAMSAVLIQQHSWDINSTPVVVSTMFVTAAGIVVAALVFAEKGSLPGITG